MEVTGIEDIVSNSIKRKYLNVNTEYLRQRSWNLKNVAKLELVEEKGNIQSLLEEGEIGGGYACNQISLNYTQLFTKSQYNPAKQDTKFLVLGEAGVGKTILCTSIAEDWANGKVFEQFLIVLVLPLHQRNITLVNSLPELLHQLGLLNPDSESGANLISYLMNYSNEILIICDEWDDYYKCKHYSNESFLHHLIFGNPFPNLSVTVMITARPGSFPPHMVQDIDRLVIVKGFNKDTIANCVHSEFNGDMERMRQLEGNVLIESMCRVPLNLALIINLSHSHKEPLPDTMTELYKRICWSVAQISIRDYDVCKSMVLNISSYSDLPKELQHSWWVLCEVAYRNISERCVAGGHIYKFFTQSEVARISSTELKNISYFGLLKVMLTRGDTMHFCFLHQFIEEYLAALHLARQKENVQLDFIKLCTENNMCRHLTHFWRFYFGTIIVNESLCKNVKPVQAAIQMLSNWHSLNNSKHLLCYYSLEAKNKLVNSEVMKVLSTMNMSGAVSVNFARPCNSQDCVAMIHVIESIDQKCSIEISFQGCNLKMTDILRLTSALKSISSNVQIQGLDLSDIVLEDSDSVIAELFYSTAGTLFLLQRLFLRNCGIGTKSIDAIFNTLAQSSSKSLIKLDLSFNKLSISNLLTLQGHIKSSKSLVNLKILSLKGSLSRDIDMDFFASFIETLTAQCLCLQQLDLTSNDLGMPGNPALASIISQLINFRGNFDLRLDHKYMEEVDSRFVYTMEEAIRNKGTINQTIAHGVIVGPGRSGKNTLMNRLLGKRSDPDSRSLSTGVMEAVVKVEVKKMSTDTEAVNDLEWQRLEYNEEALELIMTTTKNYSASQSDSALKPSKYIIQSSSITNFSLETNDWKAKLAKFLSKLVSKLPGFISKQSNQASTAAIENISTKTEIDAKEIPVSTIPVPKKKDVIVYSSELNSASILKKAVELRRMDRLREHLESSWSLYLTNTGGQFEFQEHLSLLACGPSIFFITFPLHHKLEQPYKVRYDQEDSQVKPYQSTTTLLEELLQTLATIDALNYASKQCYESESESIKPKVFFIGTHRDKIEPQTTAEKTITEIDQVLQTFVRQTSLFRQGSIQFAQQQPTEKLMFAVDNHSIDDSEFQKIRLAVQQTVERREYFTVKCPSSWLVFSLVLRAKHKSNQVLSFKECFSIAQGCGISDHGELSQALTFIHLRLGLVRYFNVEGLNELVIIDPQILFDRITDLLKKTFISVLAEMNEIEDFYQKGILPIEIVEIIAKKCDSDVKIPLPWLTKLLNYHRIAALFRDQDGEVKYFFPAALCHAPEPISKQFPSFDSLLIGFESGFCPRGVPGALIKTLMTNEMESKFPWELRTKKIFRNQVSFGIEAYGDVTIKFFPTHIAISIDTDDDELNATCIEARTQIKQCMKIVSSQFSDCPHFLSFYCTLEECKTHPHPAKIEWRDSSPYRLKCKIMDKQGIPPPGCYRYFSRGVPYYLDKEIDFCYKGVHKHLGRIADSMVEWKGRIADELGLTNADVASIKEEYPSNLTLQSREALNMWKRKLGSRGTYNNLIKVFERAGYKSYADNVIRIMSEGLGDIEMSIVDQGEQEIQSTSSQPSTYPSLKPLSHPTPIQCQSPQEDYVCISAATAKTLPKGSEVYSHNVLESCHVRNVPILQEKTTELVCGKDHTQEVAKIEKQIIAAANLPKLTTSQRRLVLKCNVNEVLDLSRGPNSRQRHKRTLFIFNDLVVVCKQRRQEQYQCRNFFPLLRVLPVKFETEYCRNGVQLLSAIERKVLLQCTCDSLGERATLLEKLEETLKELEEMENERIEELGTSLSAKPNQDVHIGGSVRHSSTSKSRGQSMDGTTGKDNISECLKIWSREELLSWLKDHKLRAACKGDSKWNKFADEEKCQIEKYNRLLEEIEKLKKTNADSNQVKILMLRQKVANLKSLAALYQRLQRQSELVKSQLEDDLKAATNSQERERVQQKLKEVDQVIQDNQSQVHCWEGDANREEEALKQLLLTITKEGRTSPAVAESATNPTDHADQHISQYHESDSATSISTASAQCNKTESQNYDRNTSIPNIGDRPTLHELQLLEGVDGRKVRVIERVAPKWMNLAIALGFDQSRIMIIEEDCRGRVERASQEMFMRWLEGEHDLAQPCTWDTLIKCLRRAAFGDVASSLRAILKQ